MNRLELSQSKYQGVFCRFYEMISNLLWYIVLAAVISVLFSTKFDPLILVLTTFVCTFMFAAYIWFFYSGRSKRIVFLKDGFEFYNYENKRTVNWSEYEGYKITKSIPSEIRIKVHDRTDVVFSYYTFSSAQRTKLFDILDECRE
ncbi:hypothetical protein GNIT_3674 [Glaciecola nitratireducens FR1064]|uniref:YcxB-like protein domain-containing protein n=1 Tax=Glaciecola nitratireducens (strain JCM 12485 / KCTC 12276 / FR1064) TaxID=1085623 RepID=G4QNG4_GLANF|nr:hypothetical protein GNIT_3674 [Glaciecola nitratireducens FR1064]